MSRFSSAGFLIFGFVVALAGCGGPLKQQIKGSQIAAGSDATITAKIDTSHSETQLNIEATNLPPPDRIDAGANNFVVWERKDPKGTWSRIGSLEYDAGGRSGKWQGKAPETNFDMMITVEKEAGPASPSGKSVFETHIQPAA
jgi:hypothetical protein